ncbi:S-layer homology domain-containing protein [Paenibacillus algorifonticola]|uniref:S-layer homology domain-containing protein n=1 Tax=Paenibacillus algorifonticola TaxID=684063 RepID=A0A1I2DKF3_9BACL|nr:S-layer homology domain-containing protein [Paenibacillus algorifonticola]SFE81085.1 S-layer homology domain-containing protein [Paenibacillus algorifonticola]
MRIRTWSLTLIIGLCLSLFPSSLWAAVSVNPVAGSIHPGSQINITGTSDLSEVIIKVYRPDRSILYFNVAKVSNGTYSDTITLGANEVVGTYEINVGQADQISTTNVVVTTSTMAAAPVANPASGAVAAGTSVTLSSSTAGAAIYYTTNGSNPTTSSTLYSGPIVVSSALTFKAIAVADGKTNSEVMSASYTIADSTGGGGAVGGGGSTAVPSTDKVISTNGNLTLPVGRTGEVSLNSEVIVSIPANATAKELKITIAKLQNVQGLLTNQETLASSVFEILKNFTENFSNPVTLTFTFNKASLKSGQKASVFYFDEVKKTWVEVGGTVSGNQITVAVDHFTKYAVMAVAQPIVEPVNPAQEFNDISGHWAEANIKKAIGAGIVSGYPDGSFKPNATVTRAEFAVMLMNTLKPQEEGAPLTFTDTATIGAWAQKAVAQAVQAGITKGYADGAFHPNAQITRAEMTAMLANAAGIAADENAVTGFADDKDIPAWAKSGVAYAKQAGIVQGKGDNQFAPQAHTTRAEAVTVLLNILALQSK